MPWHPPIAAQCNDAATVCDTSEGWSADIEKEVSPQIGNSPFHNEVIYSGKQWCGENSSNAAFVPHFCIYDLTNQFWVFSATVLIRDLISLDLVALHGLTCCRRVGTWNLSAQAVSFNCSSQSKTDCFSWQAVKQLYGASGVGPVGFLAQSVRHPSGYKCKVLDACRCWQFLNSDQDISMNRDSCMWIQKYAHVCLMDSRKLKCLTQWDYCAGRSIHCQRTSTAEENAGGKARLDLICRLLWNFSTKVLIKLGSSMSSRVKHARVRLTLQTSVLARHFLFPANCQAYSFRIFNLRVGLCWQGRFFFLDHKLLLAGQLWWPDDWDVKAAGVIERDYRRHQDYTRSAMLYLFMAQVIQVA